jgi:hypothetical protein
MQRTAAFRKQHDELVGIAGQITQLMDRDVAQNSTRIRGLLAEFSGVLKLHLAAEDRALYPALLRHKDATLKALAAKYMSEMGGLVTTFGSYLGKWPTAVAIGANGNSFRSETTSLFQAVKKRIDRENGELYVRVDSMS